MNKEWSELNKLMQTQIKKKDTYDSGMHIKWDETTHYNEKQHIEQHIEEEKEYMDLVSENSKTQKNSLGR